MELEYIFNRLSHSKFRSRFHLSLKDIEYIKEKGIDKIEEHAHDFVSKRLSSYPTINDGKQTPMKGHPVFVAQHATATCCRGCISKWYGIDKDKKLTMEEQDFLTKIIMTWIIKELK